MQQQPTYIKITNKYYLRGNNQRIKKKKKNRT
jgi:hypothetical protein